MIDENNAVQSESLVMSYGYTLELSEGAIKSPIFHTSMFGFEKAEAGKAFFEVTCGLREKVKGEELGLTYSGISIPDPEILENRRMLGDGVEECAGFESGRQYAIYRRQCGSPGAMNSFDIRGTEKEAFRFLNALRLIHLAVSHAGTESLAEHPATMTHVDVSPEQRAMMSISEKLVRHSLGAENADDIIHDIDQALSKV